MEKERLQRLTFWHGDCFQVMPQLAEKSIDLVIADLPYGTTDCNWDKTLPLDDLWANYSRLLKPGGAIILTTSQPFTSMLVASNLKEFKVEWIWEKNAGSNFGTVKWQPMKEHESVLVFANGTPYYRPIMEQRAPSGLARVQTVVITTPARKSENGKLDGQVSSKRQTCAIRARFKVQPRAQPAPDTKARWYLMRYFLKPIPAPALLYSTTAWAAERLAYFAPRPARFRWH